MAKQTAAQKAATAAINARNQSAVRVAIAKTAGGGAQPASTPASKPAAAAPAAPAQPAAVDPFFTADDLDALNAFTSDLHTKLQAIDTGLQNAETDTTYQKTQTDQGAKASTANAQDDAIGRGIFSSSVKDATLYDIEAQRSLSDKFLDDKLTTARLDAGTNKTILGNAKVAFDTNMAKRGVENAQGVNDANSSAWATAQAAWASANPVSTPIPTAPATPASAAVKPPAAPAKGVSRPTTATAPAATTAASTNAAARNKAASQVAMSKSKVKYGN